MAGRLCATVCATLLLLSTASLAQEPAKPEAPKPKTQALVTRNTAYAAVTPHRRVFLFGVSLLAASKTADAITTRQVLDRGGWENDHVFGRHPSPAKQSLINLGIFGVQAGVFYLTERNRHAWIRWTGRAFLAHEIEEHTRFAACNAALNAHPLVTQNCERVMPF